MPSARLRTEILAARTRRHAILQRYLPAKEFSLLQLSLNLPGAQKRLNGIFELYRWAEQQLSEQLPELFKIFSETDTLGPWGLFSTPLTATEAKMLTTAIEKSRDFARLLDIDVYSSAGQSCDRRQLGLEERTCLICAAPAQECMRLQQHSFSQLKERLEELLKPFSA